MKHLRAKDLIGRFLNKRPHGESYTTYSRRLGIPFILSYKRLMSLKDVDTGLLYQICKDNGYLLMAYNPNPPDDMEKCYIIDNTYAPQKERTEKVRGYTRIDPYTNELFRRKRKYKGQYKKFVRVGK